MALYRFGCDNCDIYREYFRPVAERDTCPVKCVTCGEFMRRMWTAPAIRGATVSRA